MSETHSIPDTGKSHFILTDLSVFAEKDDPRTSVTKLSL